MRTWLHWMGPFLVCGSFTYLVHAGQTWTPYKGVRIAPATCLTLPDCLARKSVDQGFVLPQKFRLGEGGRNPATILCGLLRGHEYNLRDSTGGVTGVCYFQDKSKIPSWDLMKILK